MRKPKLEPTLLGVQDFSGVSNHVLRNDFTNYCSYCDPPVMVWIFRRLCIFEHRGHTTQLETIGQLTS